MNTTTFSWPDIPDMRLSTNGRRSLHWSEESGLVKAARTLWRLRLMSDLNRAADTKELPALPWEIECIAVFPKGQRRHDVDALAGAFKPLLDSLVDIHLLPSDSPVHLEAVTYRSLRGEGPLTLIRIQRAGQARPRPDSHGGC